MKIIKAFGRGFGRTNLKWRMAIYLWLVNLIFSMLFVSPLYFLLQKEFSRSLFEERLARGIDFVWLGDLIYKFRDFYPAFWGWLLIPGLVFLLLSVFIDGGIIGAIVAGERKISLGSFFGDCGRYFFRFLQVFLISLIGYVLLFGVILRLVGLAFDRWAENASSEWTLIYSANLKFLFSILLFSIVRMFFDYVKIRLAAEDSKKTIKATIGTAAFLGRQFFGAWLLYLLVGVLFLAVSAAFLGIYRLLPSTGILFLLVFLWQQAYIFLRQWIKIMFFATEYRFYEISSAANP